MRVVARGGFFWSRSQENEENRTASNCLADNNRARNAADRDGGFHGPQNGRVAEKKQGAPKRPRFQRH
jgi:hypothetical protein